MRHIGRCAISMGMGIRGATLITIALFGLMLAPPLALGIAEGGEITAPVGQAPVNTVAPTLTGTPTVGQTLTCSTGTWANSPTSFSYVWLRSGVPITGQTANKYVVQAADQGHTITCQVTAGNGGGNYTVTGLPTGSYTVSFYSEQGGGTNYLDQYYNGKAAGAEATPVAVTAPATTGGVNAELHAGGEISGRVTATATHAPIANVYACAYEATAQLNYCQETNSNGEYTITGIPTGSYVVEFSAYGLESYFSQYYNGKSSSSEAQPVGVTAGTTVAGINAELQSADQGGQISGAVTAKGGSKAPLERIEVCADDTSEIEFFDQCVYTNSKGEYLLSGLPEGSFNVSFYAEDCRSLPCTSQNYVFQYYEDKSSYEDATPVPVVANATTPLPNAEMEVGGEVEGRVLGAGAGEPPLTGAEVCVYEGDNEGCAETEPDGHYKVEGLPTGTSYTAVFNSYSGDYLSQTVEKISVEAKKVTKEGDVKLAVGGQITGRITGAPSHGPVENVDVCAEVGGGYGGRCGLTNANGEYTISALATNTYTVNAFPEGETVILLSQSVPGISVTAGNTTPNVDAELQVGGQISGTVTDAATRAGIAKIDVCAQGPNYYEKCAFTSTGAASASAASNALTIPGGGFVLKKVSFDSKSNVLEFFFNFPTAGKLSWALFFRNSDVGFADSLGLSLQAEGIAADLGSTPTLAETARRSKKSKKCKKGYTKHGRRCVRLLVPFGSGSEGVPAGAVEIKVHAGSKAIKALKAGHTLHVSGIFRFQSALGGPVVRKVESAVVHPSRHTKKHRKHKRK